LFSADFEPAAEILRDGWPFLFEVFERRFGWSVGKEALVPYFDERRERVLDQAIAPDTLGVEDVAEGFEDATV